jgi:hypothetical protein
MKLVAKAAVAVVDRRLTARMVLPPSATLLIGVISKLRFSIAPAPPTGMGNCYPGRRNGVWLTSNSKIPKPATPEEIS